MKYPITPLDFARDFDSFVQLSRAIYGDNAVTDQDMYRWLAPGNIYNPGGQHLFHVAKDGDKVVASDCLQPAPLIIKGKRYLAAWSIKTMTHPDYRRQGIFTAMTQFNIAKARETGVDVILGFANANSFPGYKKFGWDVLFERRAVLRPLDIREPLRRKIKLNVAATLLNSGFRAWDSLRRGRTKIHTISHHNQVPQESQALWPAMEEDFPVLVERVWSYLDWRYNQRPRHDYQALLAKKKNKPAGLLIYRFRAANSSCILVDYVGPADLAVICDLMLALAEISLKHNIRYIISSSGETFDTLLEKKLHFRRLAAPMANNMFIACILNPQLDRDALAETANWFYSYGDSELDIDLQPR